MEGRIKTVVFIGVVALAALLAFVLFRNPGEVRSPETPTPPGGAATSDSPASAPSKAPASAVRPQGNDGMGIPLDPERIAQGVVGFVKEHGEILARLKGALSDSERSELKRRAANLAGDVGQWTARLPDHKAFQFKDLFATLFRENPTFKYEAAGYLAALPGDSGHDVLIEGLRGEDIHARAASAEALEPYLIKRAELPDALRAALRKALSDNLSAVVADPASYGTSHAGARDLAVKLRGIAVRLLTKAQDVDSIPALLDLETGKDGVGWSAKSGEEVDALYRLLAKHPPPLLAERLTAVVDGHLAAEPRPGVEPPGNPVCAALLLAALGRPDKLDVLRSRTYQELVTAADANEAEALDEAEALLELRDARAADWLLDRLTSADERVRGRAGAMLAEATGQKLLTAADLRGEGNAEDKARWTDARRRWSDWWTAHRQTFQLTNPYAPR